MANIEDHVCNLSAQFLMCLVLMIQILTWLFGISFDVLMEI